MHEFSREIPVCLRDWQTGLRARSFSYQDTKEDEESKTNSDCSDVLQQLGIGR